MNRTVKIVLAIVIVVLIAFGWIVTIWGIPGVMDHYRSVPADRKAQVLRQILITAGRCLFPQVIRT